jgi:hypothetical protein
MSYQAGEALWLARLRAMPQFNGDNTSRGKWGIRNTGKGHQYAILKPGTHTREMIAMNRRVNHYQTIIQLWQKYTEDGQSAIDLTTLTSSVLAYLDTYPQMGDTTEAVIGGQIIEVREMQQIPPDAPVWLFVELVGAWDEENAISFAE